jgi:transketolase
VTESEHSSADGVNTAHPDWWPDLDTNAVDSARLLAADAVQKTGNGHPGTAMSLAPLAYLLYQRVMRHDPTDPTWVGRDRFVLSNGHSSLTQYCQLFLSGYGLELADIEALRTWGSRTPGHPEYGHTLGVEVTTGPLGQGVANGVGMAMASRRERGLYDPDTPIGESPFDHHIYVIAGDGCMEEGISSEASSLAGHQKLGNLILFYDDNHISIEGDTKVALSEDVAARYAAYGWHTLHVSDVNDVQEMYDAFEAARAETERPTLISVRTIIGWPAPTLQNTGKAHGAALGAEEVAKTKEILGFDPEVSFYCPDDLLAHVRQVIERGRAAHEEWQQGFDAWDTANPERSAELRRISERRPPAGWDAKLPDFAEKKALSTRKASGACINAIAPVMPELWGGSADLAESNNTEIEGADSFLPESHGGSPYGRILHFGIREHAMGAILSGIALHGPTRPYGGTFLVFSDYMRPAVRLAAVMQVPVTYVWTHDSIGLGEDGPTHQPVEHLAALRAIPGLSVVRPADANETAYAWRAILERQCTWASGPVGLALTRQNVPVLPGTSAEGVARGGYVLAGDDGVPDVILIATGSEVQLALSARETLAADGVSARVVSMPCVEWFAQQDAGYQESVLPAAVTARVSVEAGIAQPWWQWIGSAGRAVSLEHFGASADYQTLFTEFGITAEATVAAARESIAAARR